MSEHEPEASPEQQEAVRRLLAQARHDEPVPDDVVRRLDTVLSQLAAEGPRAVDPPPPPPAQGDVVDLGARRRRRVTGLLAAAAAVVVLGVGAGQVVDLGGSDDDSASSAGSAADSQEDEADSGAGGSAYDGAESATPSREPTSAATPPAPAEAPSIAPPDVPAVSRQTFATAVLELRDRGIPGDDVVRGDDLTTNPLFVCEAEDWGEGTLVAVRYEGMEAVLAYRPPLGESQVVDLLQCGSGDVLRSTTIPVD